MPPNVKSSDVKLPSFSTEELVGKSYIHTTEDGGKFKATVTKKIGDLDAKNHQKNKFLLDIGDGANEDIVSYVDLLMLLP